ncbi:MAG: hypothetical protein AAF561_00385 [Planctomycetota bacterium]
MSKAAIGKVLGRVEVARVDGDGLAGFDEPPQQLGGVLADLAGRADLGSLSGGEVDCVGWGGLSGWGASCYSRRASCVLPAATGG